MANFNNFSFNSNNNNGDMANNMSINGRNMANAMNNDQIVNSPISIKWTIRPRTAARPEVREASEPRHFWIDQGYRAMNEQSIHFQAPRPEMREASEPRPFWYDAEYRAQNEGPIHS